MNISFILNGEDLIINSEANVRLIDILRMDFSLLGTNTGCLRGKCGFCVVLFNGKINLACLIPAFKLQGSEIITIEGFSMTDEYNDILSGFSQAGLKTCGFCTNAKILVAENILDKNKNPSRSEILSAYNGIRCRCTDPDKLVEGIEKTIEIRHRRLHGR